MTNMFDESKIMRNAGISFDARRIGIRTTSSGPDKAGAVAVVPRIIGTKSPRSKTGGTLFLSGGGYYSGISTTGVFSGSNSSRSFLKAASLSPGSSSSGSNRMLIIYSSFLRS